MWSQRNPLRSVIFTDGRVRTLIESGGDLVLEFEDYCSSLVRIWFRNVRHTMVSEDVYHYEVMAAEFETRSGEWRIRLKDDDGEVLLDVSYANAEFTITPKE